MAVSSGTQRPGSIRPACATARRAWSSLVPSIGANRRPPDGLRPLSWRHASPPSWASHQTIAQVERTHTDIPQLGSVLPRQAPLIFSTAAATALVGWVRRWSRSWSRRFGWADVNSALSVASLCSGYLEALDDIDRFARKDREMRMVPEKAGGNLQSVQLGGSLAGKDSSIASSTGSRSVPS
jgi:hypothetical protein